MPTLEIINERFATNIRTGLFSFIRKSPEVSIGGDARAEVQRLPARDRGADQLQHRLGAAAARPRPGRLRPAAGVRGDRRPLRRRRQVPHAHRGARLLGHRAAHHPPPGRRGDGRLQARLGRHLPARARLPALGDAAAVRQHRHSRARSSSRPRSRSRSARPAARSTSAFPTRRSSRSATCSTRRCTATRTRPTGAGST